jgi:hypothetical protein
MLSATVQTLKDLVANVITSLFAAVAEPVRLHTTMVTLLMVIRVVSKE